MTLVTIELQRRLLPAFAFGGAFLLFVLEPMVGRILLPAYGGGFHVWTTCLMFFQGVLLLGYLYAHFVAPRIGRWHVLVACAPLCLLPIRLVAVPDPTFPVLSMLVALFARIAIPFAVLSTTGIVAQSWLARSGDGPSHDPYRLYAASNAGSLLGLLAYPFVVEPWLGLQAQRWVWSGLYLVYVALTAALAPAQPPLARVREAAAERASDEHTGAWFALSAATSMLLMAVTNALSFDVGSIPLVWVAPLALYLASFVVVFRDDGRGSSLLTRLWPAAALAGLAALVFQGIPGAARVVLHLVALFATCMAAHRELHRLRPAARSLTKYYVVMSVGSWLAAVFVTFAAPVLFDRLHEYVIAVALVATTLSLLSDARAAGRAPNALTALRGSVAAPVFVTAVALVGTWLAVTGRGPARKLLLRNHYGLYQVGDVRLPAGGNDTVNVRQIVHNGTIHGAQVLEGPQRTQPIGYYDRANGLGDVMKLLAERERPYRVGVVGLGAGATASYLGPRDEIVFYEIDADDEKIAREWFSYLDDCAGETHVVIGDARLTLAADDETIGHGFDLLLVDAFSGDAVPTHLLTREALTLYRSTLRPGGLLLFHITNRLYDLRPVLEAQTRALGMYAASKVRDSSVLRPLERRTVYWAMSLSPDGIEPLLAKHWQPMDASSQTTTPMDVWTDDYVNTLAPMWAALVAAKR